MIYESPDQARAAHRAPASTTQMAARWLRPGGSLRLTVSTALPLTGPQEVLPQRLRYPRHMSGARNSAVRPAVQHSAPRTFEVLPQRLRHLGEGRWRQPAYAAVRRDPRSLMSATAEQATHSTQEQLRGGTVRRLRRRRGHSGPGSDQHCHSVHVTLPGPTGSAHPKLVRGVSRDRQGPRFSKNRGPKTNGSSRDPNERCMSWVCAMRKFRLPPTRLAKWETWEFFAVSSTRSSRQHHQLDDSPNGGPTP